MDAPSKTPVTTAVDAVTGQPGARVTFKMKGPDLEVELFFEDGAPFDPSNPAHLLGWFVTRHGSALLPRAHAELATLLKQQANDPLLKDSM